MNQRGWKKGRLLTISGDTGEFGSNQEASREIREIDIEFDNPKPTRLIESIVRIFTNETDLVLDSFAGSGTTAHAVLALNNEDDGNRKFILVECEDYADSITAERVRRVIIGSSRRAGRDIACGLGRLVHLLYPSATPLR